VPEVDLHFVLGLVVNGVRTANLRLDVLWKIPEADDAREFLCSLFMRYSFRQRRKIAFSTCFGNKIECEFIRRSMLVQSNFASFTMNHISKRYVRSFSHR